jgi:hypothetical protein
MMMNARTLIVAGSLMAYASLAGAQRGDPGRASRGATGARGQRQTAPRTPAERQALVGRVRQAFAGVVQRELKLDDSHMQNLQRVDRKYEQQRRVIQRDERDVRLNLRSAMQDSASVDQNKVARYLDQLVQGQRRRAELLEAEQKELSDFLTPMQRAQYFALRERVNRRLQELQRQDSSAVGRRGGPPPER